VADTLYDFLPKQDRLTADALLGRFLEYTTARGLELYSAQEEAILELFEGRHVILNTPTGSGKSLVAAALHFHALAHGRRSVYTCPIKALVNEKWMNLCREFGPDNVGLSTGDATVNRDAPILCCTAEVLANMALRGGAEAPVQDVVMDEFHWYADRDRGVAWQVPLLTLPKSRFLLMSATLGDTVFFEEELTRRTERPAVTVRSVERPVPLEFSYVETPLTETLETLLKEDQAPVYVVHFTQAEAAENAQNFTSLNVATRDQKAALASALEGFKFNSPYGPDIKRWLRHGIGLHHAGLLPKYRVLVEQLAQKGLLKLICGTDTLGVGVNVPIRTVLFTRLSKYDGQKVGILTARDFHQISGRAGRKGFDDRGWVVIQAPEHVVENLRLERKSQKDGKKFQRRQPPDKGWVNWDRKTFDRLVSASPERLSSRFQVTHAMLLNVLSRPGDGCTAMRDLIRSCHDSPQQKKAHTRRGWQLFRSLIERGIVEFTRPGEAGVERGSRPGLAEPSSLRVHVDLQDDFSMDQTLSLYLLETVTQLDPAAADYPLKVLTLAESILENPDIILRRQLDHLKSRKIAEWKQEGMEYFERMEELEKLEYPKPEREFIYGTFNAFADRHPWVGQENIRPKSIAREMYEEFMSFADYIHRYELQRSEGLLLRHLHSTFKVLAQTVPDAVKTEAVREVETYLSTLVRQVDSSLLEEWERMRDPSRVKALAEGAEAGAERPATPAPSGPPDPTRDARAFLAGVRHQVFTFLRLLSLGQPNAALEAVPAVDRGEANPPAATVEGLRSAWEGYLTGHGRLCLDPEARNLRHTHVQPTEDGGQWRVAQTLVDPEGHNDWSADFVVDLARSREVGEPVVAWASLGPIAA
jgi:superfamily II DNA/RNA helicase